MLSHSFFLFLKTCLAIEIVILCATKNEEPLCSRSFPPIKSRSIMGLKFVTTCLLFTGLCKGHGGQPVEARQAVTS